MNSTLKLFFVILVTALPQNLFAKNDRCGGDGPIPLSDVSSGFLQAIRPIVTVGGVKEFAFLEKQNTFVYRNSNEQLFANDFSEGKSVFLSSMRFPLSQLVSPGEDILLARGVASAYHMKAQAWVDYDSLYEPVEHLFWGKWWFRDTVFSVVESENQHGQQSFRLIRYSPSNQSTSSCAITPKVGAENLKRVHGPTHPHLYFYSELDHSDHRDVTLYEYDTSCRLIKTRTIEVAEPLGVRLEAVYRYGSSGPTALKFDHPTKSLILVTHSRESQVRDGVDSSADLCQVFDIGNRSPIFLDDGNPTIATWSRQGLELFYLKGKKKARLTPPFPNFKITSKDLWLARDGKRLFVTPLWEGETVRHAFQIDLNPPKN